MILAYIDPGVGAIILQGLIAAGAGLIIFFRRQIARVLGFFGKSKDDTK